MQKSLDLLVVKFFFQKELNFFSIQKKNYYSVFKNGFLVNKKEKHIKNWSKKHWGVFLIKAPWLHFFWIKRLLAARVKFLRCHISSSLCNNIKHIFASWLYSHNFNKKTELSFEFDYIALLKFHVSGCYLPVELLISSKSLYCYLIKFSN